MQCSACERTFPVIDGIVVFNPDTSAHGEYSAADMEEILHYAAERGWREALRDKVAPDRPRVVDLVLDPRRARLLEPPETGHAGRALDYGAGYGGVSRHLAARFDEVVALDEAMHRIRFLGTMVRQDRLTNIRLVCHNQTDNLPFDDDTFDSVVLTGVLEYLPLAQPAAAPREAQTIALREIRRVVRPGGQLQIETKNAMGWQYWLGARDHNGIPFASLLPLGLANRLSLARRGKPYRIVNYCMPGYRRLLHGAGWEQVRFRWPYPGYQDPDQIIDLDAGHAAVAARLPAFGISGPKAAAIRAMSATGLLQFLVPNYSIIARKP